MRGGADSVAATGWSPSRTFIKASQHPPEESKPIRNLRIENKPGPKITSAGRSHKKCRNSGCAFFAFGFQRTHFSFVRCRLTTFHFLSLHGHSCLPRPDS